MTSITKDTVNDLTVHTVIQSLCGKQHFVVLGKTITPPHNKHVSAKHRVFCAVFVSGVYSHTVGNPASWFIGYTVCNDLALVQRMNTIAAVMTRRQREKTTHNSGVSTTALEACAA